MSASRVRHRVGSGPRSRHASVDERFDLVPMQREAIRMQRSVGNRATTAMLVQRDESMKLGPLIKQLASAGKKSRPEKVLSFLTKWGKNASPFTMANIYLRLAWPSVKFWRQVSAAAAKGRALVGFVGTLETGAKTLRRAVEAQRAAYAQLPSNPLKSDPDSPARMVTRSELEYVERYYNTAAAIANDAMAANAALGRAIAGWDRTLAQANNTKNFTRKAAWEAITMLELRFDGSFRQELVNLQQMAASVQQNARYDQYVAADIIGKWTPAGFQPPATTSN